MNIFASRLPAIKFLTLFGGFNVFYNYFGKNFSDNMISIQEYIDLNIDERTQYNIMGVIKPRSVKLITGVNKKFCITDSINDLHCKLQGNLTSQVKQGDTVVISAICPNPDKKQHVVVKNYVTKHSMETKDWMSRNNVYNKAYGLQKFK